MISYIVPEDEWDEKTVKNLPSEDDRFEFKEIIDIDKISKEICAFANSFGGTLFLGIEDKNGIIKGVDKLKGNKPTTLWLEQIIPTKLEFRFGSFRVREVSLKSTTQRKIGKDKTVIAIDVFDSDLVPYQVVQTRIYYRRENSSSKEAPHSYLAYLWSRSSTDKTRVVQYWITEFLTPLITFTKKIISDFESLKFYRTYQSLNTQSFVIYHPISWSSWENLREQLSGEQFLRTYNNLKQDIINFENELRSFENFRKQIEETILSTNVIKDVIQEEYKNYLTMNNLSNFDENLHTNQMLTSLLHRLESFQGNNQDQIEEIFSRLVSYSLFEFQIIPSDWRESRLMDFCKELIDTALKKNSNNNELEKYKNTFVELRNNIISVGNTLLLNADVLRHELSLRHNTTY